MPCSRALDEDFYGKSPRGIVRSISAKALRPRLNQVLRTQPQPGKFAIHYDGSEAGLAGLIRECKSHAGALINYALHDGRTAVEVHDGFYQGKTQT